VNVDLGIWSKLTKLVVGLVVIAILMLIFMCYRPLIQENERMRREILKMDEEIKAQEKITLELSNEITILRNDPKTVERLTREKLGYARPDETVIHFETAPGNSPNPSSTPR
jgi:cell division protein FtsB